MRLKKLLIFLLIFCFTFEAHAGFFGGLFACLSNPCNCFGGDRIEHWGDQKINRGPENKLCAPWNKGGGRNDHTCLVAREQTYPDNHIVFKQNICAEETPESNYFEPKIRIRDQECNAIFCWTTNHTLSWEGQCKTLAGPYGLPLTRMCARIALPEDPIRNMPADPGYTRKKQLDFKGELLPDPPIYNFKNEPIDVDPPKLCVYLDPAFAGVGLGNQPVGTDSFDLSPSSQVFHKTYKLHPIIRILIFFLDMMASAAASPADMMAALANMMGGSGDGGGFFKVIGGLFEAISWLIKAFFALIKEILKAIGQVNRVISDFEYGCVEIPLAPFPPPFCKKVQPFFQPPLIQKICETDSKGDIEPSTLDSKCVYSSMRNNFIHNSVRVGYEYLVPLCRNGENPQETDMCVTIDGLESYGTVKELHHIGTNDKDILKLCSETGGSKPCINASICGIGEADDGKACIPYECSVTENGCNEGIRLVYGMRNKARITPINHYRDDLDPCQNGVDILCQEVWGVNISEFIDVSLQFPKIENTSEESKLIPLTEVFSLRDNNGKVNDYNAIIPRDHSYNKALEYSQSPTDICISRGKRMYGCVTRAAFSKPEVHKCSDGYPGLSCNSDILQPQMIVSASVGGDSVAAIAIPKTVHDDDYDKEKPTFTEDVVVTLAGYGFDVFVTDDEDTKKPFSGERSINPSTIYGLYEGNQKPVDDKNNENPAAIYLKDIEYVNGRYYRGGTAICIQELNHEKCPINPAQCVLTKIKNNDVVNCEIFIQKMQSYPGISVCPKELGDEWTDISDNIPKKSGGSISIKTSKIRFKDCELSEAQCTMTKYCYESPVKEPLCKISNLPEDRIFPEPTDAKVVLGDNDYYDVNFTPTTGQNLTLDQIKSSVVGLGYDKTTESLRDKTSYEKGLCVEIEKVYCDERDDNNATWPRTASGDVATGTCKPGFTQKTKPLIRNCIPDDNFKGARFENLDGEVGCQ